jgi:DNA-binding Lrp family transcriptional regulator
MEQLPLRYDSRANSVAALREENRKLSAREDLILAELRAHGPGTDREIARRLGFSEMNCVRPRITHLIEIGIVRVLEDVKCKVTNKTVRRVTAL